MVKITHPPTSAPSPNSGAKLHAPKHASKARAPNSSQQNGTTKEARMNAHASAETRRLSPLAKLLIALGLALYCWALLIGLVFWLM